LLLDEPTTHLDPPHQVAVARLLMRHARAGCRVLSVLHDLSLALRADHLWVMQRGELVMAGSPNDSAMHAALTDVFAGAIRIQQINSHWCAVPYLEV
jgi:iron complex transport system ATP-binding protein